MCLGHVQSTSACDELTSKRTKFARHHQLHSRHVLITDACYELTPKCFVAAQRHQAICAPCFVMVVRFFDLRVSRIHWVWLNFFGHREFMRCFDILLDEMSTSMVYGRNESAMCVGGCGGHTPRTRMLPNGCATATLHRCPSSGVLKCSGDELTAPCARLGVEASRTVLRLRFVPSVVWSVGVGRRHQEQWGTAEERSSKTGGPSCAN